MVHYLYQSSMEVRKKLIAANPRVQVPSTMVLAQLMVSQLVFTQPALSVEE